MTEHLPIQRWTKIFTRYPASEVLPNENGEYVTYADHLAALRACEQRVREDEGNRYAGAAQVHWDAGYAFGVSDAREAVSAVLAHEEHCKGQIRRSCNCSRFDAINAIDALREEKR